ncbi:MAG: ribulose-phosphate 3-epimerase [Candidatus Woesearchaeota archaeon]
MEKRQVEIVPSLLCKTKKEFLAKLKRIEPYVKRAQFDIMDNKFVPNRTVQPKEFRGLRTRLAVECQLMVREPKDYLTDCCRMNAKMIIFHYESYRNAKKIIELIHQIRAHNMKAGIAINPKTPASKIKPFLNLVDMVLIMTVNPGFGGQKLIPATLKKAAQIRKWAPKLDIEVDGGINKDTAPLAVKAGANILVAGNAIHKAKTVPEGLAAIKRKL